MADRPAQRPAGPPLGKPLPDDADATSVSLPGWADVIAYEERRPACLQQLACGYPRFFFHPDVSALFKHAERRFAAPGQRCLVLPSAKVAEDCRAFVRQQNAASEVTVHAWPSGGDLYALCLPAEHFALAQAFWQHSGNIVSSRHARAALTWQNPPPAKDGEAKTRLRQRIADLCGASAAEVLLFPTGMAAIYAAHQAIRALSPTRRSVQLGVPYLDTLRIQQVFGPGVIFLPHGDDSDLRALRRHLRAAAVSAVFCEVPNNPLLRTVDLEALQTLLSRSAVPLIIDDTVCTSYNLDLWPRADLLVSSLTKFFSGVGNVMGGALVLRRSSPFYAELHPTLTARYQDLLWQEDAAVLVQNSADFPQRMARINASAEQIAIYLAQHPRVARVYYPTLETADHYRALRKPQGGAGGLISFVLEDAAQMAPAVYDHLPFAKGPSFGTHFTLACPYTLLVHYHEQAWAASCGVSPHLLRISVGVEDPQLLIAQLGEALECRSA